MNEAEKIIKAFEMGWENGMLKAAFEAGKEVGEREFKENAKAFCPTKLTLWR